MTVGTDYFMAQDARHGTVLFWSKRTGMLHSHVPQKDEAPLPVGVAAQDLDKGRLVRVLAGLVRHLIYNPCGDRHLGRCCINGLRADGTRGFTCTHCGDAITGEQRDEIAEGFAKVAAIAKQAGCVRSSR